MICLENVRPESPTMILQERDIKALSLLSQYFMLTSRQLREMCFTTDSTGRVTRRRLTGLRQAGYVRKRNLQVVNPKDGSNSPVFHLTRTGLELLAGHFDDDSILRKPVEPSQPQHLQHYTAVSETQRLMHAAVEATSEKIRIDKWVNEDEALNLDEADKPRRFLRTKFGNVVCIPDAAYVLEFKEQKAIFYLEQDRDTFFHDRVAARKSPGYQQLWEQQGHRQHFPETNVGHFYILFVAPSAKRRDQLCRAFAKKNDGHEVQKAFRFVSFDEATPDNVLFESIFACCHHTEMVPMVKRGATPTTEVKTTSLLPSGQK